MGFEGSGSCPRCGAGLSPLKLRGVRGAGCPKCRGLLVALRDLRRVMESMARDLRDSLDPDSEVEALEDAGGEVDCPVCGDPMESFGYLGLPVVKLDRCEGWESVWLDPDELVPAATLFTRTELRARQLEAEAAKATESFTHEGNAVRQAQRWVDLYLGPVG